ncbi:cadherin-like protein 26 [Pempheris klunzingeri]|uniref:cadherin-like protein 26 n=1 Tax=Pempheris klunzingeri TaxID=3127111 RepID=UPI0039815E2D
METIHLSLLVMLCVGIHGSSSGILQRHKRSWIIDSFTIDEGYDGPFPYSLGTINIEKDLVLFRISGQGVDKEPKDVLRIDNSTGEITVYRPVDYEKFKVLKLIFQSMDKEKHVIDTQLGIEIKITDSNDNTPKFESEMYNINIKESTLQGTEVITIKASDHDSKMNGQFDLKIVSVTPESHDLKFYLKKNPDSQTGTISFKGCLDHKKAKKYMIIVEAKDHGKKTQLSSSCTIIINVEDGNNCLPVITGQTGPRRVKEREENVLVSRLQVTDNDTYGTAAWRAKFQIQGDTNNNFRITTDPRTNEGLLYVEKQLDYEDSPLKNVTISVENEIPYHLCKVVSRRAEGLWEVDTTTVATVGGVMGVGTWTGLSTYYMTVTVEDVNDPPIFDKPNKDVNLGENVKAGQDLVTFTARDPDIASANTLRYKKGDDPADWVTVDPVTGEVTTSKEVDRESPFVKDNIYTVTIHAVDDGKPPTTGTATLNIHIADENDNAPFLAVSAIDMCQSDGSSLANITVLDLDEVPYGGPFNFKLLGDVKGKWKVDPGQGYSVELTKERTVHSGLFELLLEITDFQGQATVHNLLVTVCSCLNTARPNCQTPKATSLVAGRGAVGIILFSILLFAGVLPLAFLMSCKEDRYSAEIPDEHSGQNLLQCNTEKPGTDCQVFFRPLNQGFNQKEQIQAIYHVPPTLKQTIKVTTATVPHVPPFTASHSEHAMYQTENQQLIYLQGLITDSVSGASQAHSEFFPLQRKSSMEEKFARGNSMRLSVGASSNMRTTHQHRNSTLGTRAGHRKFSANQKYGVIQREILLQVLKTMLYTQEALEEESEEYSPHVYAEEEDTETIFDLDAISIPDISFDPELDLDLDLDQDFRFNPLALICLEHKSAAKWRTLRLNF